VAAEAEFSRAGLKVPIEAIAKRAGVGVGTVCRHFPTKQVLIEAVLTAMYESLLSDAETALEHDDAGAAFLEFFEALTAFQARHRALAEQMIVRANPDRWAHRGVRGLVGPDRDLQFCRQGNKQVKLDVVMLMDRAIRHRLELHANGANVSEIRLTRPKAGKLRRAAAVIIIFGLATLLNISGADIRDDPRVIQDRHPRRPSPGSRTPPCLQAAQHRRSCLLPAPPVPRRRHQVRQTRLCLAGEPSTWPRSGSGSAIPFHDLQDAL
jgi:AcrR family transcriptional regulator